jgi:hypothetical protein
VCIHLVDRNENWFRAAAQSRCGLSIQRHNTLLHVHNYDDYISRFNGQLDLFESSTHDDVIRLFATEQADSAGVHECERAAMPFDFSGNAIAGYAGTIVNDGDAATGDAVEKRGFSDVRATDDGDKSWHTAKMMQKERL